MFALGAFICLSQGYNHEIQSTHDMNGSFGSKCSGPLLTTNGLRTDLEIAWISDCHLTIYLRHIFELIVDGAIPECDIPCLKKESRLTKILQECTL